MSARRLLPVIEIVANEVSCGVCAYLDPGPRFARCRLFTGVLEEGNKGPHRADECLEAEARAKHEGV